MKELDAASDSLLNEASCDAEETKNGVTTMSDADIENYDLSDPTAVELLLDSEEDEKEDVAESRRSQQIQKVQKTLLSVEIARQKGVEFQGDRVCVPGRLPLSTFTLLEIFFCTLGFATGFIHFTAMAKNFLFAHFIVAVMLVVQIIIYHSSYRAKRTFMTILQTLGIFILMALVGWAYSDLIIHPLPGVNHHLFLGLSLVSFVCIPLIMLLHLVYFGRGYRYITLKHKVKASEKPTKLLKIPENTPTKIIKT